MSSSSLVIKFFFVLLFSLQIWAGEAYPVGPNPQVTPGSLCPSGVKRYPEGITYCERNVKKHTKDAIIRQYDEQFGFHIRQMNRQDFKIDHFIPLSIGGSNDESNLWPQHKSVFSVTDPLEDVLFAKISTGKIKQAEAIRVIREAKLNLGRVPELIHYVSGL
jgi:hypothetical protein